MATIILTLTAHTTMSTERAALLLSQWLSPAFPVGAFAYSHGLETAVAEGAIADATELAEWLTDLLLWGAGASDARLLAASWQGAADTDDTARAFASSAERLRETELQGAAFVATVSKVWDHSNDPATYPVAIGAAAAREGLPLDLTISMYLQAFVSNLISAAVRLVPLGQTDGQVVLKRLTPLCERISKDAMEGDLHELSSLCWASDIAAMRHETQTTRLFRT
ncbi:urease accessory protein UreF [Poseidonocella pacifica]|nr:urease accessory UreF family protein [Poseidonocella pacifica]